MARQPTPWTVGGNAPEEVDDFVHLTQEQSELTEEFMPGFGEEGGAAAAATAADMDVDLVFSQTTPPIPEPQNSPLEPPFSPNSTSGGESPASYCGDFSGEEADASFDDVPVPSGYSGLTTALGGRTAVKLWYHIVRYCTEADAKSADEILKSPEDEFVAFHHYIRRPGGCLSEAAGCPPKGTIQRCGDRLKTRVEGGKTKSLRDKLKGDTPFDIEQPDGTFVGAKTSDPPFDGCVRNELLAIQKQLFVVTTKNRVDEREDDFRMQSFLDDSFYSNLTQQWEEFKASRVNTAPIDPVSQEVKTIFATCTVAGRAFDEVSRCVPAPYLASCPPLELAYLVLSWFPVDPTKRYSFDIFPVQVRPRGIEILKGIQVGSNLAQNEFVGPHHIEISLSLVLTAMAEPRNFVPHDPGSAVSPHKSTKKSKAKPGPVAPLKLAPVPHGRNEFGRAHATAQAARKPVMNQASGRVIKVEIQSGESAFCPKVKTFDQTEFSLAARAACSTPNKKSLANADGFSSVRGKIGTQTIEDHLAPDLLPNLFNEQPSIVQRVATELHGLSGVAASPGAELSKLPSDRKKQSKDRQRVHLSTGVRGGFYGLCTVKDGSKPRHTTCHGNPDGDASLAAIQPLEVKWCCGVNRSHTKIALLSEEPKSRSEIVAATKNDSPVRAKCSECNKKSPVEVPAIAYFRCCGTKKDGTQCKASSLKCDVTFLSQLIQTPPGQQCTLLGTIDEPYALQFDPCGCIFSIEAVRGSVKGHIESGIGRNRVAKSDKTGQWAFPCPGGKSSKCAHSFLHDIHHLKVVPLDDYNRIKEWARDRVTEADDAAAAVSNPIVGKSGDLRSDVEQALNKAVLQVCPQCGLRGQKNGDCCHLKCKTCSTSFCYFCSKRLSRSQEDAESICDRQCPIYLNSFKMGNGVELSSDRYRAMQEFSVWRALRLLREIYDRVGPKAFGKFYMTNPDLFDGFGSDDCVGTEGTFERKPLPGVNLTLKQIRDYRGGEVMP